MSAYPFVPLAEVATVQSGYAFKSSDWTKSGVPVLKIANIRSGMVELEGCGFVDEVTAAKAERFTVKQGDSLIAMSGSVGQVGRVRFSERALINQRVGRFSISDPAKLDPDFLYYFLQLPATFDYLTGVAYGSVQPNISPSLILDVEIPLPSLSDQRLITSLLCPLDDKIAANTKLAKTSIELASAEFTRLSQTSSESTILRDVLRLEYGKSLPAKKRIEGDVDVFGSGGIVGTHNESLLPGPGVIVGRKGTAGSVHWAPRAYFPIDTTFYVVPANPDISLIFCFHLLDSLPLNEMNSDSAVPGLNREEALSTPIRVPAKAELRRFSTLADRLFSVAQRSQQESRALITMRDALLPQLMSGKLRVKDAEKILEGAL